MSQLLTISVFLPFVAAVLSLFIKEKSYILKITFTVITCFTVFALLLYNLLQGEPTEVSALVFNLTSGGFQSVYSLVTAFMWLCAALLSFDYFKGHHNLTAYFFFFLVTLGATLGVFLSADLFTTFIFFEVMSFASYTWVVQERNKDALSAGKTYLAIAVIGGMVCLMGLFLLHNITDTLRFGEIAEIFSYGVKTPQLYVASFCMLVGFGAKAGLFPLHIWLPKAHPVAPAPASALLSGVLTKTGIFGILVITAKILPADHLWGNVLLILGTVTMLLGAVLAVFSVNLKRTLACSSLSQIGFITVGASMLCLLGEENALAANGTVLYMLNHSIVKLVLFLCAGVIYMGAHTLDLNRLKGYGRNKPVLFIAFLIGACSLAGIPGFCGYLSKTLVHESIVEYAAHGGVLIDVVEWLFLFSGGLTAAYMLKLFVTIFILKPDDDSHKSKKVSPLSSVTLMLSAVLLPVIGVMPHVLGERLTLYMVDFVGGHELHHTVHYFAFANLKGVIISLTIGAAVYYLVIRKLLMREQEGRRVHYNPFENRFSLEENIYKPLYRLVVALFVNTSRAFDMSADYVIKGAKFIVTLASKIGSDMTDFTVYLLKCTVFGAAAEKHTDGAHRYSYAIGDFLDRHSKHGDNESETKADLFASVSETISRTTARLSASFSFALFMTCFGICLILLFLLLSR